MGHREIDAIQSMPANWIENIKWQPTYCRIESNVYRQQCRRIYYYVSRLGHCSPEHLAAETFRSICITSWMNGTQFMYSFGVGEQITVRSWGHDMVWTYLWYCFVQAAIAGCSGWCAYRIGRWLGATAQWWRTWCGWSQRHRIRTISMRWNLHVFQHLQWRRERKRLKLGEWTIGQTKQLIRNAIIYCSASITGSHTHTRIIESIYGLNTREFSLFFSLFSPLLVDGATMAMTTEYHINKWMQATALHCLINRWINHSLVHTHSPSIHSLTFGSHGMALDQWSLHRTRRLTKSKTEKLSTSPAAKRRENLFSFKFMAAHGNLLLFLSRSDPSQLAS